MVQDGSYIYYRYENVNENWVRRYDEKPHGDIDVAIAAEHLCLAATEKGLGTCWVCNYDTAKMQQFFRVRAMRRW